LPYNITRHSISVAFQGRRKINTVNTTPKSRFRATKYDKIQYRLWKTYYSETKTGWYRNERLYIV